MEVLTEVTEEALRELLGDTLGHSASRCAVTIAVNTGGRLPELLIGIPYDIEDGCLVVGPYMKNIVGAPPKDYEARKKPIPIESIVLCRRLECRDLFGKDSFI